MSDRSENFDNLDLAGRATAAIVRRPRVAAHLVLAAALGVSWFVLLAMSLRGAADVPVMSGPGGDLLQSLPLLPLPPFVEQFFRLCVTPVALDASRVPYFAALSSMWFLMSLAMMLPSAAPMLRTYCEIADTARARDEAAVHPLILVAGYVVIWALASLCFAGISLGVQRLAMSSGPLVPAAGPIGAVALLFAGLYQFSGLKEACLRKCRNPFSILFSRWSTRPCRIFRLGMKQGVWCLGCCWALMLVMFAVGLMNILWMTLIALFTVVEKQSTGKLPGRIAGAILLVWAAALLLVSH
ncbi:MAG: DUF2182 domain-containing protein [Mesorhizobium sp.]|jgi:predicted metal-binding membrane protein